LSGSLFFIPPPLVEVMIELGRKKKEPGHALFKKGDFSPGVASGEIEFKLYGKKPEWVIFKGARCWEYRVLGDRKFRTAGGRS
jgi:hypothetical protein